MMSDSEDEDYRAMETDDFDGKVQERKADEPESQWRVFLYILICIALGPFVILFQLIHIGVCGMVNMRKARDAYELLKMKYYIASIIGCAIWIALWSVVGG